MRNLFAFAVTLMLVSPAVAAEQTIVGTAAANPEFSTLVAAVKAAGLAETLSGTGPFTVFAPTNEAFAKLPAGTVEELLKPENKDKLTAILTYHVVPGRVLAAQVVRMDGRAVETAEGGTLPIRVSGAGVKVGASNVIKTDIACTNGVIHAIDTVLMPPAR